jgi:hypothetical protein
MNRTVAALLFLFLLAGITGRVTAQTAVSEPPQPGYLGIMPPDFPQPIDPANRVGKKLQQAYDNYSQAQSYLNYLIYNGSLDYSGFWSAWYSYYVWNSYYHYYLEEYWRIQPANGVFSGKVLGFKQELFPIAIPLTVPSVPTAGAPGAIPPPPPPQPYPNAQPLAGVKVTISPGNDDKLISSVLTPGGPVPGAYPGQQPGGPPIGTHTTDARGVFAPFTGLTPGRLYTYVLQPKVGDAIWGTVYCSLPNAGPNDPGSTVNQTYYIALPRRAITGSVYGDQARTRPYGPTENPAAISLAIPKLTVVLTRTSLGAGAVSGTRLGQVATTTTDASGNFVFDGLQPGDYRVTLRPNAAQAKQLANVTKTQTATVQNNPVSVYFGPAYGNSPPPVPVAAPAQTGEIRNGAPTGGTEVRTSGNSIDNPF